MSKFIEKLDNILGDFYPKITDVFDIQYQNSKENLRLLELIREGHSNSAFKKYILKKLLNISKLKTIELENGQNFPCYIFQIILSSNEDKIEVININISFIAPYYFINRIIGNIELRRVDLVEIPKLEYKEIRSMLEDEIGLTEFNKEIMNLDIPHLRSNERFTYFNAFFTDTHRVYGF